MAFDLPSANPKYSQSNENQARKATELAIQDILTRLTRAEAAAANGGGAANPPTASFSSTVVNADVSFTDTSRAGGAAITTWAWDFGDGGASTLQNPSYTYADAGTYSVTLTVEDADGETDDFVASVVVSVPAVGPTADFSAIATGLSVKFTDTSTPGSAPITGRSWQFGDGQLSTSASPTHVYASGGTKSVTLTVTDANGLSDPVTKNVAVTAPTGAPLYVGAFQGPVGVAPGSDADVSSGYYTLSVGLNADPTTIVAEINEARSKGIKIIYNFAGPRSGWLPGGTYSPSAYLAKVDRFTTPTLKAAIQAGVNDGTVAGAYLGDEFYLFGTYNGSVSPADLNDMGLQHKSRWPGMLTFVRVSGQWLRSGGGWSNTDGVPSPPPGGYTGLDYSISQFERAAYNQHLSIQGWYDRERTYLNPLNIGILPALNWAGAGPNQYVASPDCWDYLDNGSSSGVVGGAEDDNGGLGPGVIKQCSDPDKDLIRFRIGNPALIAEFFNYCATQADFPGAGFWTYPRDGFSWSEEVQPYYYNLNNIKQAFRDAITTGKNRTGGTGWRTAK